MAKQGVTKGQHVCMMCDYNNDADKENRQPQRLLLVHSKSGKESGLKRNVEFFLGVTLNENPRHVVCYNHSRKLDRWWTEVSFLMCQCWKLVMNKGVSNFMAIVIPHHITLLGFPILCAKSSKSYVDNLKDNSFFQ